MKSFKQAPAEGRSLVLLNDGGDTLCEKVDVVEWDEMTGTLTIPVPTDVEPDEVATWAIVKDDLSPKEMFQ